MKKRLPFYLIFLVQGVFLGMGLVNAQQLVLSLNSNPAILPSTQQVQPIANQESEKAQQSNPGSNNTRDSQLQGYDRIIKNTDKLPGLFTLYRHKATGKIYLEIKREQLHKNYLATITMASGIGERGIYSGLPLQDFLFYLRRVNNNLHFIVRNVNFRTSQGDPQARSVDRSFSDSVLYSLPIKSTHPQQQTMLVDLGDLLLKDVPNLSAMLTQVLDIRYQLDKDKTYFGAAKAFPLNIEIDSVYNFSSSDNSSNRVYLPTVPDTRALTLKVHYSFSQLPENNGYVPRLADERIGYFITTYQDFSKDDSRDLYVRYINRWHLQKQDISTSPPTPLPQGEASNIPSPPLSPPKQPIVFWIENTVPLEYRDAIREGVLMWNKAFEKAGFKDAIQVRQMPDDAKWNPADVRYNTIRWLNSLDGAFARGPSRVNPLTGQILDADIIVDAGLVRSRKQEFRALIQSNQSETNSFLANLINNGSLCTHSSSNPDAEMQKKTFLSSLARDNDLCYGVESANQLAMGSVALSLLNEEKPSHEKIKEYVHQFVRSLIAHEVGHTLGLRHNFRGSTFLKPEELNNTEITRSKGMSSSVMDYLPVNLAPPDAQQGDYFTNIVGPYDEWAIEYGYKISGATAPAAEKQFLAEITQKQTTNPELSYSPDEDSYDLDPTANRYDMSSDPLRYSLWQLDNARLMWDRLNKRSPADDESYSDVSELFDRVFVYYLQNVSFIMKYIGGQSFYRDRPGSANARLPFEAVSVEKQREALTAIQKYVFAEDAFNFPPELLNKLAPSRWEDWSDRLEVDRLDYPIHDSIFMPQSYVLRSLLSNNRLKRLRDIELKTQSGQALTMPELFNTLQTGIWTEVLQAENNAIKISSLRRALQREHLNILVGMVLRTNKVPEDARTLAWEKLRQLRHKLDLTLKKEDSYLDDYTKAHLEETRARIYKVLDAPLPSKRLGRGG
ncbi:zinc-dependent metalloprotease [Aerosakkonema funiforme]|uniref:Zinc-dependent metalloprotease n=1 Tax=Aerosakkonema funiforme FACHB-1375 TaxID=2949571 RepID=A0A926VL75_9CYAN|nr:zinc-dependent metalloprotease [Aerosakkonema funiforme]MBD2185743.1 zinc-dependent metalloprotease [Aerosakkonema funiforme FACHB-1375]